MGWIISQGIRIIGKYESELVDGGERWLDHRLGGVSIADPDFPFIIFFLKGFKQRH